MSLNMESLILGWAGDRGILSNGTVSGQMEKLQEELDELKLAIAESNQDEILDAIGDMQVVLIILAQMQGMSAYKALMSAYGVIAKRTGKMVDGVFVKDTDEES